MSRRRPWQVYFQEERNDKWRSRSFYDEVTAVEWAKGAVRELGSEAKAHVHCKDSPESPTERGEASFLVTMQDGELLVTKWEPRSEMEDRDLARRAIEAAWTGSPIQREGVHTTLATDMGLRQLPKRSL